MSGTPLIETLSLLSDEEIQQLDKFVHSPLNYYPKNAKSVVKLFDLLKVYAPKFEDSALIEKEHIAQQLGTNHIDQIIAGLHWVVRRYISWVYLEESSDEFYQQLGLLDFYLKKRPFDKFETQFKAIEDHLHSKKIKSNDTFYKLFLIHYRKSDWMQTYRPSSDNNLRESWKYFNFFSMVQKAQIIFNLKMRSQNASFEFLGYGDFLHEIKAFINPESQTKSGINANSETEKAFHDLLNLYYLAILILDAEEKENEPKVNLHETETKDSEVNLEKSEDIEQKITPPLEKDEEMNLNAIVFQKLLLKNKDNLPKPDYWNLVSVERSLFLKLAIKKIEFTQKVFEVYRRHLEEGILSLNGLKYGTFSNIIRYSCRCDELTWTEIFLSRCKPRYTKGTDLEVYNLYTAYYYLHKEDFYTALGILPLNIIEPFRKVEARCFHLMILSQIQFQYFDKQIDSFSKLVARTNELTIKQSEAWSNFVKVIRKLVKLDPRHQFNLSNKRNIAEYNKKIEVVIGEVKNQFTAEAIWLIKQLEKLKKH